MTSGSFQHPRNKTQAKRQEAKERINSSPLPADVKAFAHDVADHIEPINAAPNKEKESTYAWTFKPSTITSPTDRRTIYINFLGTCTVPFFAYHASTGHTGGETIAQNAYQTGVEQGCPTILVKGIGTPQLDEMAPIDYIVNPSKSTQGSPREGIFGAGIKERVEIALNNFFIPEILFQMMTDETRDLSVTISGHSRGAITTYVAANAITAWKTLLESLSQNEIEELMLRYYERYELDMPALEDDSEEKEPNTGTNPSEHDQAVLKQGDQNKQKLRNALLKLADSNTKINMKVLAMDPVEGAMSLGETQSWQEGFSKIISIDYWGLPTQKINYATLSDQASSLQCVIALDERRTAFQASIPLVDGKTAFSVLPSLGCHSTPIGFERNGANQIYDVVNPGSKSNPRDKESALFAFEAHQAAINLQTLYASEFISEETLPIIRSDIIEQILIFKHPGYLSAGQLLHDFIADMTDSHQSKEGFINYITSTDSSIEATKKKYDAIKTIRQWLNENPETNKKLYFSIKKDIYSQYLGSENSDYRAKIYELRNAMKLDTPSSIAFPLQSPAEDRKIWLLQNKEQYHVFLYSQFPFLKYHIPDAFWYPAPLDFSEAGKDNIQDPLAFNLTESSFLVFEGDTLTESEKQTLEAIEYNYAVFLKNCLPLLAKSHSNISEKEKELVQNSFETLIQSIASQDTSPVLQSKLLAYVLLVASHKYYFSDYETLLNRAYNIIREASSIQSATGIISQCTQYIQSWKLYCVSQYLDDTNQKTHNPHELYVMLQNLEKTVDTKSQVNAEKIKEIHSLFSYGVAKDHLISSATALLASIENNLLYEHSSMEDNRFDNSPELTELINQTHALIKDVRSAKNLDEIIALRDRFILFTNQYIYQDDQISGNQLAYQLSTELNEISHPPIATEILNCQKTIKRLDRNQEKNPFDIYLEEHYLPTKINTKPSFKSEAIAFYHNITEGNPNTVMEDIKQMNNYYFTDYTSITSVINPKTQDYAIHALARSGNLDVWYALSQFNYKSYTRYEYTIKDLFNYAVLDKSNKNIFQICANYGNFVLLDQFTQVQNTLFGVNLMKLYEKSILKSFAIDPSGDHFISQIEYYLRDHAFPSEILKTVLHARQHDILLKPNIRNAIENEPRLKEIFKESTQSRVSALRFNPPSSPTPGATSREEQNSPTFSPKKPGTKPNL